PISAREVAVTDGYAASIAVSASGAARPLSLWGPDALTIAEATTPFGPGIRIETGGPTHVWWPVDGGPFWAGLTAPPAQIDGLLARVVRLADIATPSVASPPDKPGAAPPPTGPTSTAMAPAPGSTLPVYSSVPDDASDPT